MHEMLLVILRQKSFKNLIMQYVQYTFFIIY